MHVVHGLDLDSPQNPDNFLSGGGEMVEPGEDGYSLMRRVKAWARESGVWMPAVALTAYARAEDRVKVLDSGFQIHIPKPVELAELVAVIVNLVERPASPWSSAPGRNN
ncbi:MAG TPA: hypothetical protein VI756_30975 [Blastocatellia bacterium]